MILYTMGFTQKSAEQFFEAIRRNEIEILVDVRLNNQSQLAGFTKGRDLPYFLKEICHCEYDHNPEFAPTKEILQGYKKGEISWEEYEPRYLSLLRDRGAEENFRRHYNSYSKVLLLCSEPGPERCHRRLLAEYLQKIYGYQTIHI
ncbi:MAG: DUF488 domain-containing protein [Clostridiales bacterium]|nr:DUF488 domain-containing protein [Clostridiales bacterium]